jgi:hypothetical protein
LISIQKVTLMEHMEKEGTSTRAKIAIALLAGLVVVALLFYWGGCEDSQPPVCYSMFMWYTVPSDAWVSWAAGAATAAVVFLALWLWDRRR